jgi:hypothetical protein
MTAINGTAFIAKAIQLGGVAVENINNDTDQALVWLSQAIVNRHSEVCDLMNKWEDTSGTVDSTGYTIDLPADWDNIAPIELFTDENYQNEFIDFEERAGKIRFDSQNTSGQTFYIRYRKEPNNYDALDTTIVETANPRLLSILLNEFISIFMAADNDLDSSSAESAMKIAADKNS